MIDEQGLREKFGRVAVLMGGWSAEREVSLKSGTAVITALLGKNIDAYALDLDQDIFSKLQNGNYDRVFNIVHGRGGEDGVIQGILDMLKLPYTGSGVMASAISMDKLMTKRIWTGLELSTPAYKVLKDESDLDGVIEALGLPLIVKPSLEGSSIGMSKVTEAEQLAPAFDLAKEYGEVFVEQWIIGKEYTASVLGGEALPLIRLEVDSGFYDYEAKYQSNDTRYFCPSGLDDDKETELKQLACKAFTAVNASGWGRVDIMVDNSGKAWLIEVNTVPGMTDHSLVPMAAKQQGMEFDDLVVRILELAD